MKKGIFILVLTAFVLPLANIVWANELTDDYFDIANNFYKTNNFTKAVEYLDLIINIEPNNAEALALRNKIMPPPVELAKNAQVIAKVLTGSPVPPPEIKVVEVPEVSLEPVVFDADYYNRKGQEFYQKGDYKTAIEYFYKSITVNKKIAQAYNNLAMAYWCQNNIQDAIRFFKKAYSTNHNYTQPLDNLSNLYKNIGDRKKQLAYLKQAVKSNSNDYLAYYWLGNYFRSTSEYPKAISSFQEAIKINPKYSKAYLNLAMCFFETEQFNYTVLSLNQYMEFYPDSDYAYFLKSKAYLAMCSYENAKNSIEKAIEINNTNEYQLELAKIDYAMGDYSLAMLLFQNSLQKSESSEAFNYVGLCYYKLKNIDFAIINIKKAIELDGLRPIYYYNLAQCYKSIGDKRNYVKYVNTATKITPINYQDYIDLSYIYFDNNNAGYAINSLNDAIKKYPCVKSLYLAKLKIYEAIGDNLHYNETKNYVEMEFNKNEKEVQK